MLNKLRKKLKNNIQIRKDEQFKELSLAIKNNDIQKFENINEFPFVNDLNFYTNSTLLKYAVENGNYEICKLLLNHPQIDINSWMNFKTALHISIEKGFTEIFAILMNYKDININIPDYDRNTALHLVIKYGREEMLDILLQHDDVNLNLINLSGERADHLITLDTPPIFFEKLFKYLEKIKKDNDLNEAKLYEFNHPSYDEKENIDINEFNNHHVDECDIWIK